MSWNSSILRFAARASSPVPSTQVSSRGVIRRQSHRAPPRRKASSVITKDQIRTACAMVNEGTGVM